MSNIPFELLDYICGFGFPWLFTTFRLVNKQLKEKVDRTISEISTKLIEKKYYAFIYKTCIFDLTITVKERDRILMLNIISKILHIVKKKQNTGKRIPNEDCATIYNFIYNVCLLYNLNAVIYIKLEKLFDYTFAQCWINDTFCVSSANYYLKFYRCIFSNMIYHTRYLNKKEVNAILEERFQLFITQS
jgi:hypothetical protein